MATASVDVGQVRDRHPIGGVVAAWIAVLQQVRQVLDAMAAAQRQA